MGYTSVAVKGVSWMVVLRAATRAMSFIRTIILARILIPSQFGAYGVALLILGLLEVMTETGVNVILIQEKETDKYVDSAWIVSIVRGIIIALILVILTPFIVVFFHSPESATLLYTMSIVPFLRGFINPSVVKFQKQLHFHKEFWYRFCVFFIDATTAIIVTLVTHNPIGIVIGLIAGVVSEIILSYTLVIPRPVFRLHKEYINKIFHRGKWITASGVFNYLFHNADNIIVGRMLGTGSLGVYQIAYSLSILPITEIADVFSRVTLPVFTRIAVDKKRLQRAFIKTQLVITVLSLPFGVILFFFPKEIVYLLLGQKWLAAVPILPILAVFGVVRTISGSASTLFLAVGKQEYATVATFVSIVGLIIPIIPLVMKYGIYGAALSALIGSLVAVPIFLYYTVKIFHEKH